VWMWRVRSERGGPGFPIDRAAIVCRKRYHGPDVRHSKTRRIPRASAEEQLTTRVRTSSAAFAHSKSPGREAI
jgi:hypothetical protein